jgi:Arc/MetJ family transcription regulator
MRTTLNVDDSLFEDLLELTEARTKTEAVRVALREYVRMKRLEALLDMRGTVAFDADWQDLRALDTLELS